MEKKHLFVVLAFFLVISGGDWSTFADAGSLFFDFDATTTSTPFPPYDEGDAGLYFPYGSRTSTTTGPPYNPYDQWRQRGGIFSSGDYTSTSTPKFCEGLNCGPSTGTVPLGYFSEKPGAWLLEGASHIPENKLDEYYRGFRLSTPEDTLPPMAAKYPTQILSVIKPSEAARNRCKFTLSVYTLTKKARLSLKGGTTEVYMQPDDETILIRSFSKNQRVPSESFLGFVWQRIKAAFISDREAYEFLFTLPPHCGRLHDDPAAVTAEEKEGDDLKSVMFRMSPEITATYAPSTHPITFSFHYAKVRQNQFGRVRKCLYGLDITYTFIPGSLVFSSSQREATITAKDVSGTSFTVASLVIPCECRPSKLGQISWWLKRSADDHPLVLVYFGYDEKQGHPVCSSRPIRKGTPAELDLPVDYEALGFWAD
ncbi:hypothetical protein Emag_006779 [Eimeria magna]